MIPKNPLTMVGRLRRCWLFAYRTPVEEAKRYLPSSLELVTHGPFAFWNVVACQIEAMRPKGFPAIVGVSYWHVAYRLYVRFRSKTGESYEGLYFLRSDCDSRLMASLGNTMTDFNFHAASISVTEDAGSSRLLVGRSDMPAEVQWGREPAVRASSSAFDSLEQAASFLKYKPLGISVDRRGAANVVKIVRDEKAWTSQLIHVTAQTWKFFEGKNVALEVGYAVDPIDYQWNRGQTVWPAR